MTTLKKKDSVLVNTKQNNNLNLKQESKNLTD